MRSDDDFAQGRCGFLRVGRPQIGEQDSGAGAIEVTTRRIGINSAQNLRGLVSVIRAQLSQSSCRVIPIGETALWHCDDRAERCGGRITGDRRESLGSPDPLLRSACRVFSYLFQETESRVTAEARNGSPEISRA
jgi:hypothetical protein